MSRLRNLNDLIKIEDAIKVLCRKTCHPGVFCPDIYCKEMWNEFEDVERVEVVRCKDCKHRPTGTDRDDLEFPDDKCPCKCEDYWYSWKPSDDWFCGNGERKDGEQDE